jgi:hypothetical protein
MTTKRQSNRLFDQAHEGAAEAARGPLVTPGLPTLEERVGLFLRAVHGERNFTRKERADARERILDVMAADILTKSEAEFSKDARVDRPLIGAKPLRIEGIFPASLPHQHRSGGDDGTPLVGIALDELAALDLEPLAAAHHSNKLESMTTKVEFALPSAHIPAAREGALAAPRLLNLGQNWQLVHRGLFIGVAAIAAVMVVFICGALRGSWLSENLNLTTASSPRAGSHVAEGAPPIEFKAQSGSQALVQSEGPTAGGSFAAAQIGLDAPVEELVKRGRELVVAGNIPAARLMLRQAAEAGSASAALELGATYDPIYLARPSVTTAGGGGVPRESRTIRAVSNELSSADIAKAQAWYQKAKELGATEAQERLERLGLVEARGWDGSRVGNLFQREGRRWRAQRR